MRFFKLGLDISRNFQIISEVTWTKLGHCHKRARLGSISLCAVQRFFIGLRVAHIGARKLAGMGAHAQCIMAAHR